MKKYVKYIGETDFHLVKGKTYEVEKIVLDGEAIAVKGIPVLFESQRFEEVEPPNKTTCIAFTAEKPEVECEIFLISIVNGRIQPVLTSEILSVSCIEGNIYRIETENTIYITEVKEE